MKKYLPGLSPIFLFFICYAAIAQNPIPNASFENWSVGQPEGWLTNNGDSIFITQISPGYMGSYAARGDVHFVFGLFNAPPLLFSLDASGMGFPVNQGYSSLNFYYKFNQVATANLTVAVDFLDAIDSVVGYGLALIISPATNFTMGSAPIIMSGIPVTCIISVTLTDPNDAYFLPQLGNYFILDELSFGNPIGVPSLDETNYFIDLPSPNPASAFTTISYTIPKSTGADLKIYDLAGRQLKMIFTGNASPGKNFLNLDVRDLSDGMYLLVLTSEYGILQRRLVISK